jgi:Ser-tRNA(Ala) deacylase AlaX
MISLKENFVMTILLYTIMSMQTKLIYMEHMHQHTCTATIINVKKEGGVATVVLDQTVFYPQGGGQPYDTGVISNDHGVFSVTEVRYDDGVVNHIGTFEVGEFSVGETVTCEVDVDTRKIHTRLHSAGHLLDIAIKDLNLKWKPGKGYHFPQGPYIEYAGSLHGKEVTELIQEIERKSQEIIERNIQTRVDFSDTKTQNGKPLRVVYYGDTGIPCGGTHVANLKDISEVTIRKIKQDKGTIKLSYS